MRSCVAWMASARRRPGTVATWGGAVAPGAYKHPQVYQIDDAAQAVLARHWDGTMVGSDDSKAIASAFSMHPSKNLNVMGDGGFITTRDAGLARELKLLRNHGLDGRDVWVKPGYNMRLSTLQAIVALEVLPTLRELTNMRVSNAVVLDEGLGRLDNIALPTYPSGMVHSYHLYQIEVKCRHRNVLLNHLHAKDIEAKVH